MLQNSHSLANRDELRRFQKWRRHRKIFSHCNYHRTKPCLWHPEARKVQTLAPILTRTREDTKEAVIETARAGVYTFSAESKQEKGSRATFTLKLFESGSGERIAKLGARTVSGTTVLVKVLMPEAIIWDDESAFSGTLEDSDSETKFNTETGLFWKEFHD